MIKEIITIDQILESVKIIRGSFDTVADEFCLTRENCPTHPSFITYDNLSDLKNKGLKLFGFFLDGIQIGFIALEEAGNNIYYLEKLSILPQFRHKGFGKRLVQFAFDYVAGNNGKIISIGIINKHDILKKWYENLGFKETMVREYKHLPFTVCFMEKRLIYDSCE
jgi:diamine N-acetyltransferase